MNSTKSILKITYPIILSLIAQNIINVTNTAFLGRVSEAALGASAIGGVYYFGVFVVGLGFSMGAQILIGRRNGEQNYEAIGPIFNNGLLFTSLLSILIWLVAYWGNAPMMHLLIKSPEIYQLTMEYLDIRIYGFIFAFIGGMFRAFFVGITKTGVLTTSAIITAITNITLDYLLIFGHGGFPEMGIIGAAIASVISEITGLIYLVFYTLYFQNRSKYHLFKFRKIEFQPIKQTLELSIFVMFQYFISISTWFMFFIIIERMGERALAVTNIGRSIFVLLMIPAAALSTTASTLVSNLIGAGEKDNVVRITNKIIRISLISASPLILITILFPELFGHIYTDNSNLLTASLPIIRIVAIVMLFFSVSNVIISAVSGTGSTRTAFFMELIVLLFYISYTYISAILFRSGVEIVWLAEFVYWILIGLMGYWFLLKGNWKNKNI